MIALREGYRDIRIVGADHSWSRTLWVDDMNRVISVQPHFYKEHPDEQERVAREYAGYHLHDIYQSLAIAFRSYFDIRDYAATLGARIVNATPAASSMPLSADDWKIFNEAYCYLPLPILYYAGRGILHRQGKDRKTLEGLRALDLCGQREEVDTTSQTKFKYNLK